MTRRPPAPVAPQGDAPLTPAGTLAWQEAYVRHRRILRQVTGAENLRWQRECARLRLMYGPPGRLAVITPRGRWRQASFDELEEK